MRTFRVSILAAALAAGALGQTGPDVVVGSLNGMDSYGQSGGIYAYAIGTTSCNIGDFWLNWFADTNQHPVIAQNLYRLKDGRFEQIGMSWLKHGFTALSGNLCFSDCQGTNGEHLGVHCSDPYSASLNGDQTNGPRNEVNPSTGYFPYPYAGSYPPAAATIGRRIQVAGADVNPALNAGAVYFAEGHYVASDDSAAGNQNNNASWRNVTFSATTFVANLSGSTHQQEPAILGWQANDPSVVITNYDVPGDGRFIIARKVTDLGGGNHHYEFAVHNLNSHRSGRAFTVEFPAGTTITNAGFKDIAYHSGEPYSGTDWTPAINGASVSWATETYIQNVNANALRWGTLYNFWCDATAASEIGTTIEPFRPVCPIPDPVVPAGIGGYALNTAAPYDNPTLTAPINGPSGDDNSAPLPVGFTFTFYGQPYTQVWMATNGFLTFNGAGANTYDNTCLPNATDPDALIAGYWDDLVAGAGECQYQTLGTAPNRRFVASWTNVNEFGTSQNQTFKIILDETTNKITSTIVSSASGGASATRGIENVGGTLGTVGSCNVPGSAVAATSWTYTPVTSILPSADLTISGSTAPGGALTWNINSNALGAPVVLIATFDPGPTDMGPFGVLNIGFTPGFYVVLADGGGVLQPAHPAHFTDACGDFTLVIPLDSGLPPGLVIYNQGVVVAPFSAPPPPNGTFHITDPETINT